MTDDPATEAVRLLKAAHDCIPQDAADGDPRLAAILHACRMGLDAAVTDPLPRPELASYGVPGQRSQKWILRFEDTEVGDMVFDAAVHGEAQAELLARDAYRRSETNWNCFLFRIAALDPADEERQRVRADRLESALRDVRARLARSSPEDKDCVAALIGADIALGELDPAEAPLLAVALPLKAEHARHLQEITHERDRHERSLAQDRAYREKYPRDDETPLSRKDQQLFAQVRDAEGRKSIELARDVALAERVAAAWADEPASLLLPIGSIVKVKPTEQLPDDWPIPKADSIGVVTGYSRLRSRPNVVSFMGRVSMSAYEDRRGDEDRAVHYNYLPEELEIIGHGSIVDTDVPVRHAGWWPTHGHGTKGTVLYSESMVVRSNGFLWRVQPCSGPPECTQIARDDAGGRSRFDHLVPLERTA